MGNANVQGVALRSLTALHEPVLYFPIEFQATHCEELVRQVGHLFVPTVCVVPITIGQHLQAQLQVRQLMLQVVRYEAPALRFRFLRLAVREQEGQQFRSLVAVGEVHVVAQLNELLYL